MCPSIPSTSRTSGTASARNSRLGTAAEIASLVVYLASDAAAFMTGAVLSANGGQYLANG